jgi:hypothetical protein
MLLPSSHSYRYLAQGCCSISRWLEWRMFTKETAVALGNFVFEEILCHWGAVVEIVTDNGSAWVKAIEWLSKRYGETA